MASGHKLGALATGKGNSLESFLMTQGCHKFMCFISECVCLEQQEVFRLKDFRLMKPDRLYILRQNDIRDTVKKRGKNVPHEDVLKKATQENHDKSLLKDN